MRKTFVAVAVVLAALASVVLGSNLTERRTQLGWRKYSVRGMILSLTIIAIAIAPYGNYWHKRWQAETRIRHLGGSIGKARVSLAGTSATDDDLIFVANLVRLTDLANTTVLSLDLADTDITDNGLVCLSKLSNLWILDLRGTEITDAGLAHVTELTNLEELVLDDTSITGQSLEHLSNLPKLRTLRLQGTAIDDSSLASLHQLSSLENVMLAGTPITDTGVEHLRMLDGLKVIYLHDTGRGVPRDVPQGVTDNAIADLQKSLPNCHVNGVRGWRRVPQE